MADYEIVAVRQVAGNIRTHHIDAVQVGTSLFLVDQIIDWIGDGTHRLDAFRERGGRRYRQAK